MVAIELDLSAADQYRVTHASLTQGLKEAAAVVSGAQGPPGHRPLSSDSRA
jgi:hypothetical protein